MQTLNFEMGVGLAAVALLIALMQGVFCATWDVMLPQSIMGISGSCVTVACRFEVPSNYQRNICTDGAVWNKGSLTGPSVFNARSPSSNAIKGRIVGDIARKNCTTMFHDLQENNSDLYFFRLDCMETFKFTFAEGVRIVIQPGPSPPLLSSVSQAPEGAQVSLRCSVPAPCSVLPPSITWLPRDSSRQEKTQIHQDENQQMIMTSSLTFNASADHHNQNITCSVSYPLTKGGSTQPSAATQTLSVLYAPRFTVATLSTSGPVPEGHSVIFTCSSDANPPVSVYTWYRAYDGKLIKKGEGETLVLTVRQTDSGVYLCEAQTKRGSQRSRPVSLEVNATTGSGDSLVLIPYIICGVVLVLYFLTVVVDVYKYKRRLKKIEVKGEHTYTALRTRSVTSDYDQLQPRQPKPMVPPEVPSYENLRKSPCEPVPKLGCSQSGAEGLC
uniref:sialoadhesin isoform X2 n=1 Tax=Scatophagus argus TaxID=75038 RepID=UPI001ED81C0E|nr:sialoadhesin isoform X2 [Scatophagus argus]